MTTAEKSRFDPNDSSWGITPFGQSARNVFDLWPDHLTGVTLPESVNQFIGMSCPARVYLPNGHPARYRAAGAHATVLERSFSDEPDIVNNSIRLPRRHGAEHHEVMSRVNRISVAVEDDGSIFDVDDYQLMLNLKRFKVVMPYGITTANALFYRALYLRAVRPYFNAKVGILVRLDDAAKVWPESLGDDES